MLLIPGKGRPVSKRQIRFSSLPPLAEGKVSRHGGYISSQYQLVPILGQCLSARGIGGKGT